MNSITTAAITLAGGVVLFILNQWVQKFFFEPLHEQRKVIGEIDFLLIFWAWTYSMPIAYELLKAEQIEERQDAARALREVASKLVATTNAVRAYRIAWGAPKKTKVREVGQGLIALSNSIFASPDVSGQARTNHDLAKEIRKLLALSVDPSRF